MDFSKVKDAIKRTSLYAKLRAFQERQAAINWSEGDERMMTFYSQFVRSGDLVFDVGANLGNRTRVFVKLGARTVAVEPQRECAKFLSKRFARMDVEVVQSALGGTEGEANMLKTDATTISSLSPEWIRAVRESGRFAQYEWNKTERVDVTTLDHLISRYGQPTFVKVDVEGFEHEVLRGLSQPVPCLSFEFTPEFEESTRACIEHLAKLGKARFNISTGETMEFDLEVGIDAQEMLRRIHEFRDDSQMFGDIYCWVE